MFFILAVYFPETNPGRVSEAAEWYEMVFNTYRNHGGRSLVAPTYAGFQLDRSDAETASVVSRWPDWRGDGQAYHKCVIINWSIMCNNITGFKFRTWEGFSKTHGSGGGPHQSSELEVCVFFLRWILYVIIVRGRVAPKRATGSPSHLFSEIMSNHHGTWRSVSLVSLSLAIVPWKNAGFWELTAETSANLDPLSNPDTLFVATLFDLVALINKLGAD